VMDQPILEHALADLKIPAVRFFDITGSTNNDAWLWIDAGAPHCALVVADAQTAGRGRFQHHWVTPGGSGLAFSLVLLFPPLDPRYINRITGLGALAVCKALQEAYDLNAEIKWPNDVLLNRRKVAGVLVETRWDGERLKAVVLGIGINIAPHSIDPQNLPPENLIFPATCVEKELDGKVNRVGLLHTVLNEVLELLTMLSSKNIIDSWERWLAYSHQWVRLSNERIAHLSRPEVANPMERIGRIEGLTQDGALRLTTSSGDVLVVQAGEVHLIPFLDDHPSSTQDSIGG
jgi:BirA family biotin operon repressor/biotin-[acetyl-CoA-carboxylase] ligase